MNIIKGKVYFIEVLLLLIVVYSAIFIEHVDLIRIKHDESISIEPEKRIEENFEEESIKENPWDTIMKIFNESNINLSLKPIKSAVFGKWEENKCDFLDSNQHSKQLFDLSSCAGQMFRQNFSNKTSDSKFAIYTNKTMCRLSVEPPNCLFYDITAYSFTLGNMSKIDNYVLPPCIDASENWIVTATCDTVQEQNYTCNNKKWIGNNDQLPSKCNSFDEIMTNTKTDDKNNVKQPTKTDDGKQGEQTKVSDNNVDEQIAEFNSKIHSNVIDNVGTAKNTEEKNMVEQPHTEGELQLKSSDEASINDEKILEDGDTSVSDKKVESDSRENANYEEERMPADEGNAEGGNRKEELVKSANKKNSGSKENDRLNGGSGKSDSTIKAEDERDKKSISERDGKSVTEKDKKSVSEGDGKSVSEENGKNVSEGDGKNLSEGDGKSVPKENGQLNSKAKTEHVIRKIENKNENQNVIDALNFTANSNNTSQFSSRDRMGISYEMLIAIFTLITFGVVM